MERQTAWKASSLASLASRSTSTSGLSGASEPSVALAPLSALMACSCRKNFAQRVAIFFGLPQHIHQRLERRLRAVSGAGPPLRMSVRQVQWCTPQLINS